MTRPPSGGDPAPPPAAPALPDRLDPDGPPLHDDPRVRVVVPAADAAWRSTRRAGLEMRPLERFGGAAPRLSAELRLAPGSGRAALGDGRGLELLVRRGRVVAGEERWPAGHYVRLPSADAAPLALALEADPDPDADGTGGALVHVASGHIAATDAGRRLIDTRDGTGWLPGPVSGTEVRPLHVHERANAMLIRWHGAVAFRPSLDPIGEEVLVLRGCLHDALGAYPEGTWIRNPVPAWQSWAGDPGTVVYYRSGHFGSPPAAVRPTLAGPSGA